MSHYSRDPFQLTLVQLSGSLNENKLTWAQLSESLFKNNGMDYHTEFVMNNFK